MESSSKFGRRELGSDFCVVEDYYITSSFCLPYFSDPLNELNSKMDNIGDGLYFRYYSIDATSFTGSIAEKINQSVEKTTTNMKGIYLINIYTGSMWIAMAQNYSSNYASYIAFSYWTLGDDSAQPLLGFKRSGEWINKLVAIDPIS